MSLRVGKLYYLLPLFDNHILLSFGIDAVAHGRFAHERRFQWNRVGSALAYHPEAIQSRRQLAAYRLAFQQAVFHYIGQCREEEPGVIGLEHAYAFSGSEGYMHRRGMYSQTIISGISPDIS